MAMAHTLAHAAGTSQALAKARIPNSANLEPNLGIHELLSGSGVCFGGALPFRPRGHGECGAGKHHQGYRRGQCYEDADQNFMYRQP